MRRIKRTVGAAAALLVLTACGADAEAPDPVPADPTGVPTTSAPATPTPSSPSTSALETPSASAALTLAESCRAVLDDQQGAVDLVKSYVRNPLAGDVDVADLDRLRSELLAGEVSAPEPLRQELSTQVGVLDRAVQGIRDGNLKNVSIKAFEDARNRITTLCEEAGQ